MNLLWHTHRTLHQSIYSRYMTFKTKWNGNDSEKCRERAKKIQFFLFRFTFLHPIWSIAFVSGSDSGTGSVRTVQIVGLPFDCAVWTRDWRMRIWFCVIERSQFAHSPHTCSSGSNVTGLFDIYLRLEYRTSVQRAYINTSDDQNRAHQIELWKMIEMHSHSRTNGKQANIQTSNYVRSFIFFIWCVCACVLCSALCVCVCRKPPQGGR